MKHTDTWTKIASPLRASGGATATYHVAMRDSTPYARFESLNGLHLTIE